ncbi:MAG: hypothetical protein ACRC80_11220 [Waterburya sp.]
MNLPKLMPAESTYATHNGLYQNQLNRLVHLDEIQPVLFAAMTLYKLSKEPLTYSCPEIRALVKETCVTVISSELTPEIAKAFNKSPEYGLDRVLDSLRTIY